MPSPFPGMDPYLENPRFWQGMHNRLIQFIARSINDTLPPGYFADTNERVYVSEPFRSILPDVGVLEKRSSTNDLAERHAGVNTAVLPESIAVADEPLYITLSDAVRESFVEVFAIGGDERIVTAIEVLSPANKTPGAGREQYLLKQQQLIDSETHLIEIDLLRQGTPTLFPPRESIRRTQAADYAVCLHRAGQGYTFELWPMFLRDRLPRIRVPLAHDDPDLILDLQTVFDRAYDDGPYSKRVDYAQPPIPPLNPQDTEWADALLREAGLR